MSQQQVHSDYSILFRSLQVKSVTLRNRIVVPPMVTNRDITGPDGIQWYARLAQGGAGLVIVEATSVDRFASGLSAGKLRKLVDAVHQEGAAIAIQLFPVTFGSSVAPHDISQSDIEKIKKGYAVAARECQKAGFDGVEPHGAHGFLLNQFFSPLRNLRQDDYGGALANRMRLGREIVQAIRNEVADQFVAPIILYRHTPCEEGGYTIEDSIAFARALVDVGADIMDISPASDKEPADLAAPIKQAVGCPVIAVNDMDDPERAVAALQDNRADLIAIGRGLIADPEWPRKISEGRLDEIVECLKCNEKCHGNLSKRLPVECVQWENPGPGEQAK